MGAPLRVSRLLVVVLIAVLTRPVLRVILRARRRVLRDHRDTLTRCLHNYPNAPPHFRREWERKLAVVRERLAGVNRRLRELA